METALPNLHPALIHFPIAAVTLGLLADLALALRIVPERFDPAAAALWGVAALGALAAYLSGEAAHDGLPALAGMIHEAVEEHEHAALPAVIAIFAVAAVRIGDVWAAARFGSRRRALRWTALALALVAQGLVLRAADLGGMLVYRHGVAVEAVETPADDGGAVDAVETPADDGDAVEAVETAADDGDAVDAVETPADDGGAEDDSDGHQH